MDKLSIGSKGIQWERMYVNPENGSYFAVMICGKSTLKEFYF